MLKTISLFKLQRMCINRKKKKAVSRVVDVRSVYSLLRFSLTHLLSIEMQNIHRNLQQDRKKEDPKIKGTKNMSFWWNFQQRKWKDSDILEVTNSCSKIICFLTKTCQWPSHLAARWLIEIARYILLSKQYLSSAKRRIYYGYIFSSGNKIKI